MSINQQKFEISKTRTDRACLMGDTTPMHAPEWHTATMAACALLNHNGDVRIVGMDEDYEVFVRRGIHWGRYDVCRGIGCGPLTVLYSLHL